MNEVKFKANIKDVKNASGMPAPAAADAGKVLTVGESGGWTLAEGGGGGGLPAIESGDAGKVLTVNAGETGSEWAAAGGGGGAIIATYTFDQQTSGFSCDMTYSEIATHITNGEIVFGNIGGNFVIPIYSPQEYSLHYTISNYSFSEVPGGTRYLEMSCTQLTHQHIPEDSEIIQGQIDNVHWQVITSIV